MLERMGFLKVPFLKSILFVAFIVFVVFIVVPDSRAPGFFVAFIVFVVFIVGAVLRSHRSPVALM